MRLHPRLFSSGNPAAAVLAPESLLRAAPDLWACSQSLAEENWERLRQMDLDKAATPALLAYEGIQYQYMAPAVFEDGQMDWVGERVRILSGFYGALRPFDRVVPYRLEMQAKVPRRFRNLYDFWGDRLYRACRDEDGILINLASKEYSRAVAPISSRRTGWWR